MQHVKDAIFAEIQKAKKIAESKGYEFPPFVVRFDLKGTNAGYAEWKWTGINYSYCVKINMDIANDNLETYLKRTVNHELAHILQFKYNRGSKPHGREWDHFCRVLTGSTMSRCHDYAVSHLRRKKNVKRYLYKCDCRTHQISSTVHNRIMNKQEYFCKSCKGKLFSI
jgi:SprT protein